MLRHPGRNTDRGLTCQATKCDRRHGVSYRTTLYISSDATRGGSDGGSCETNEVPIGALVQGIQGKE
jgi:hypothetical protein